MFTPCPQSHQVRTLSGRILGFLDRSWSDPMANAPEDISAISREILKQFGYPLAIARYTENINPWDALFPQQQRTLPYLARAPYSNGGISKFGGEHYQHPSMFLGVEWGNVEKEKWIAPGSIGDHQILFAPKIPGGWLRFDRESGAPLIVNPDVVVIADVSLAQSKMTGVA